MAAKLTRDEAIALVERIMRGDYADDAEADGWLDQLERDLACPDGSVSGLIFWTDPQLTAAEVVDRALAYQPIQMRSTPRTQPPPSPTRKSDSPGGRVICSLGRPPSGGMAADREASVGVLYDYFRASDDEAVAKLMAATDGGPVVREGDSPVVDAVDGKGIDPPVALGKVVSFALDVPWATDLIGERLIWPDGAGEDPEYEGPWVVAMSERARDALAEIPDDRLPGLADRWSHIEELSHYSDTQPEVMLSRLREFVGLARRARTSGESIHCWICL
ncbi:hypothetical protein [Micromonospora sp. IBSANI012]|uniref:hypothetical protein n=1 Tax=Micromonospora sp. IBSANI012 TaxID=3457761 RepID=UPI004057EBDB